MSMRDRIILHHYETSPFAEKIRLALHLKNIAWASVDIPIIMPKPDLVALSGGYRRTPVMQIGADIYCDTQLIIRELDLRHPSPTLLSKEQYGAAFMIGQWTDRVWFPLSSALVFGHIADDVSEAFIKDREQLIGRPIDKQALKAGLPFAMDQWRAHFMLLEESLNIGGGGWLLGSRPGFADICAYMNLWFVDKYVTDFFKVCLASSPCIADWYEQIIAIEGQAPDVLSATEAHEIAADSLPRLVMAQASDALQDLQPGELITVTPDDTGKIPVLGKLVHADAQRIILRRESDKTGPLNIHFPRTGFIVQRADAG